MNLDIAKEWTEYRIGPTNCWAGNVQNIRKFFDESFTYDYRIPYDLSKTDPPYCFPMRNDWEFLLPCCGMGDDYIVDEGI